MHNIRHSRTIHSLLPFPSPIFLPIVLPDPTKSSFHFHGHCIVLFSVWDTHVLIRAARCGWMLAMDLNMENSPISTNFPFPTNPQVPMGPMRRALASETFYLGLNSQTQSWAGPLWLTVAALSCMLYPDPACKTAFHVLPCLAFESLVSHNVMACQLFLFSKWTQGRKLKLEESSPKEKIMPSSTLLNTEEIWGFQNVFHVVLWNGMSEIHNQDTE